MERLTNANTRSESVEESIKTVFKDINVEFGNEPIFDGFSRSFFDERDAYSFVFRIRNEKYHWASEMVRCEIKINSDLEVITDFSNGSGGWNDFAAEEILDVFTSGLSTVKEVFKLARKNASELYNDLEEHYKISTEIYKLHEELSKKKREEELALQQRLVDTEFIDHVKVTNGAELIEKLNTTEANYDLTRICLIKVDIGTNSYRTRSINVELDSYGNKRYKFDQNSISKKALITIDCENLYYTEAA